MRHCIWRWAIVWVRPRVSKSEWLSECECLDRDWVTKWANLSLLTGEHTEWQLCIHTSNCHVACCITAASIDSMYGYSTIDFMTDFYIIFYILLDSVYLHIMFNLFSFCHDKCLRIRQWFWNIFEMACFVQVRIYRIFAYYIRTGELHNDNRMKTIVNFGMDRAFNIFVTTKLIFMHLLFRWYWLKICRSW